MGATELGCETDLFESKEWAKTGEQPPSLGTGLLLLVDMVDDNRLYHELRKDPRVLGRPVGASLSVVLGDIVRSWCR